MLLFGAADITFTPTTSSQETINFFEDFNPGFEAGLSNWFFVGANTTASLSSDANSGDHACLLTLSSEEVGFSAININTVTITENETYTVSIAAKGSLSDISVALYIIWLDDGYNVINTDTIDLSTTLSANYQTFEDTFTAPAGSTCVGCQITGVATGIASGTLYLDDLFFGTPKISGSAGTPVTLPKTAGGGSISLDEITYRSLRSQETTKIITGGTGVIHFYDWPSSLDISDDPTLYDYGELVIDATRYKITLYNCKLFISPSISFGKNSQESIDVNLVFRPDPSTNKVIKMEG